MHLGPAICPCCGDRVATGGGDPEIFVIPVFARPDRIETVIRDREFQTLLHRCRTARFLDLREDSRPKAGTLD